MVEAGDIGTNGHPSRAGSARRQRRSNASRATSPDISDDEWAAWRREAHRSSAGGTAGDPPVPEFPGRVRCLWQENVSELFKPVSARLEVPALESEVIERWREETGKGARGASGWAETLEAASDGRVELLLYKEGVQRDAFRCPACGRAALDAITCPLDGTTMEDRDDGLDLAVRLTLAHGGDVIAVEHRQDLDPVDGIGALLRF